ncbi:hypothetical protein HK104_002760, partial [Borealophlyctis nickersoniae]
MYCGSTDRFCAPERCLSAFGMCWTTSPGPTPTPGQSAAQQADCLASHNNVRASVPVATKPPPLSYNTTLEQIACGWSKELAVTGRFEHSGMSGLGENLYMVSWSAPQPPATGPQLGSCAPAVSSWASEIEYYKPGYRIGVDGDWEQYGHYTQ